jgi:hypothetical protein
MDLDILKFLGSLGKGRTAQFVGGCVRSHLLNQSYDDLDVAITGNITELINDLEYAGIPTIPTGLKFGSISAFLNQQWVEITVLRGEEYTGTRFPKTISIDSFYEDAKRRDFTINAMYMDALGHITDYFDGKGDLTNHIVRFIGDPLQRIQEDPLRILRFFRFLKVIDADISDPIHQDHIRIMTSHHHLLKTLSKERISKEILKIFSIQRNINDVISVMVEYGFDVMMNVNMRATSHPSMNVSIRLHNMIIDPSTIIMPKQIRYYVQKLQKWKDEDNLYYVFYKEGEDFFTIFKEFKGIEVNFEKKKCPVSGRDVMAKGYSGKEIKKILDKIEYDWCEQQS